MAIDARPGILRGIKLVFKTGGIYLLFTLINKAIPFLLLPLLTRYIDPSGYGAVAVVALVTALAMPVVGMCSNSVLYQRYYKMDQHERIIFLNDSYKIIFVLGFIMAIVTPVVRPMIEMYLKISIGWFEIAIIGAAAGMVSTMTTALYQIRGDAIKYGLFQSAMVVSNVGLTILLVVFFEMSWEGRILAIFSSSILLCFVAVYLNLRAGDISLSHFNKSSQVLPILRLGSALIPGSIVGWAITMSDRMFLTSMTTLELVGVYAVGIMIGQITNIFLGALGQACIPHLYKYGNSTDIHVRIKVVQSIYALIVLSLIVATAVTLFAPAIFDLMIDSRYHAALVVVGWISAAYAFMNVSSVFQSLILSVEKNSVTLYVSAVALIVNFIGNYIFIRNYGMVGAAMGNALSSFSFMSLYFIAGIRYNRLPWLDRRVFSWSGTAEVMK